MQQRGERSKISNWLHELYLYLQVREGVLEREGERGKERERKGEREGGRDV